MLRSLLFVPGDSERKIAKSEPAGADAIILDLEDAVAAERKPVARSLVAAYLRDQRERRAMLMVRINPLTDPGALADLVAVMAGAPDAIVLPKSREACDAIQLGHYLDALEAQFGIAVGTTRILPIATEVPAALFTLGSYAAVGTRLLGLTWGAEDLGAAIGAIGNRDDQGGWSAPFVLARSLCLFGAATAGVAAIDTLHADFRDDAGLAGSARAARRDGFGGKIAIHPAQVAIINEAFTPSDADYAHARAVIALFEAHPGAGVLGLDGQMLDLPHLVAARRIVAARGA